MCAYAYTRPLEGEAARGELQPLSCKELMGRVEHRGGVGGDWFMGQEAEHQMSLCPQLAL